MGDIDDILSDEDDLTEELNELSMNKTLTEKEFTFVYDETEAEKKENETLIIRLRHENAQLRENYVECVKGDKRLIDDVFRKVGRRELLAIQNYEITPAISELDHKLSKHYHELDAIKYEQRKRSTDLVKLTDEVDGLSSLTDTPYSANLQQSINVRNNDIDKVTVKADTAITIGKCYNRILRLLEVDVNAYPSIIDKLEKQLKKERGDLKAMQQTAVQASAHQCKTQAESNELETKSFRERRTRDIELLKTRKEAERRLNVARYPAVANNTSSSSVKESTEKKKSIVMPFGLKRIPRKEVDIDDKIASQSQRQSTIFKLSSQFDKIKDTIVVSDVEEVVKRFKEQSKINAQLRLQKTSRTRRLNVLNEEMVNVEEDLTQLKYSRGSQDVAAKSMLDKTSIILSQKEEKLHELKARYHEVEKLLFQVKLASLTLFNKVSVVKLRPPHHNFTTSNPILDIQNCQEKMLHVLKQITDTTTDPSVMVSCVGADRKKRFMQFIDSRLPPENTRFMIEPDESAVVYFDELENRPDYLSRGDIILQGNKIIEEKVMRKRKI